MKEILNNLKLYKDRFWYPKSFSFELYDKLRILETFSSQGRFYALIIC